MQSEFEELANKIYEEGEFVVCLICGKKLSQISHSHLKKRDCKEKQQELNVNINKPSEYKDVFQNANTTSKDLHLFYARNLKNAFQNVVLAIKSEICKHCGLFFTKRAIFYHLKSIHGDCKVRKAWNKGLNKDLDERVRKSGRTLSKNLKEGLTKNRRIGAKTSEETKLKISLSRIKYLSKHPEETPWKLFHSSKRSYPELLFEKKLKDHQIDGWIAEYQQKLYCYDFAFPAIKLDIEIDGPTHLSDEKVIKKDIRRDMFSASNGWVVIRFPAIKIRHDVDSCILATIEIINILKGV